MDYSKSLLKNIKKYKIKVTTVRNGKRVYKSIKVIKLNIKRKKLQFGSFIKAKDTLLEPTICGINVRIYYYDTWVAKQLGLLYTPAKTRTMNPPDYGGPHHGVCKIMDRAYKDYIFTDNEIKIGDQVIYDINSKRPPPSIVDDNMLLASIVSCFYSYKERLIYYISGFIKKGLFIDYGHIRAAYLTKERINKLLNLIKSSKIYICAEDYLIKQKLNFIVLNDLLSEIDMYSYEGARNNYLPLLKKHILNTFKSPSPHKMITREGTPHRSSAARKLIL